MSKARPYYGGIRADSSIHGRDARQHPNLEVEVLHRLYRPPATSAERRIGLPSDASSGPEVHLEAGAIRAPGRGPATIRWPASARRIRSTTSAPTTAQAAGKQTSRTCRCCCGARRAPWRVEELGILARQGRQCDDLDACAASVSSDLTTWRRHSIIRRPGASSDCVPRSLNVHYGVLPR